MMEIVPVAQSQARHQGRTHESTLPCGGECGGRIPYDSVHRVETADGKEHALCARCCPNCFGGEGNGPKI